MQPYFLLEGTYRWTRSAFWLVLFELIVLCLLFQLLSWFTLQLTPREIVEPMIVCVLTMMASLGFTGAYKWSCFESLPTMYWRVFLGFFLGTILCASLTSWLLPAVDVFRFKFAFVFASIIVLTTVRSLICGAMTEKNVGNRRGRRSSIY